VKLHRFGIATLGLVALAALLTALAAAATAKTVVFTAKYAGAAVVRVDGSVATISANGPGTGTLLGAGKVTGKGVGDASAQPCVPFTGTGTLIGTGTTKLFFKVVAGSNGCGDEAGQVFSINARATVVKGTGKLANAKGKLKITGVYDRGKGTFSVKFAGTLTQ
jgi:hypothetical protein